MGRHKRALLALRQGPGDRRSALDLLADLIECRNDERDRTIAELRGQLDKEGLRGADCGSGEADVCPLNGQGCRWHAPHRAEKAPDVRRGANWTKPAFRAACFIGQGDSETCLACGQPISQHFGGTEYRCQPRVEDFH